MLAAIHSANAAFEASPKADADVQAFKDAIAAARAAYLADPAVMDAAATKKAALVEARTTYKAAMKSAKDAFFLATGHNPCRTRVAIPRV